jgi:TPR repeat protein
VDLLIMLRKIRMSVAVLMTAGACLAALPVSADYEAGVRALESGNYQAAMMEFTMEASKGNVQAQRRLGEMYRLGQGTTPDLVQAVKWLTLAYVSGERDLVDTLEMIRNSLTEAEVVQGEQLALEWLEEANRTVFADDDTTSLYENF